MGRSWRRRSATPNRTSSWYRITITRPKRSIPSRANDAVPAEHGFYSAFVARVFENLNVGAAVWRPQRWRELHVRGELLEFELEHGADVERFEHNERCLVRVRQRGTTLRTKLGGFDDLFVPIRVAGRVAAVLATGPFATRYPNASEVRARWRGLVGRRGDPADPEFAHYLDATLGTLTLESGRTAKFVELVGLVARMMSCEGPAPELYDRIERLGTELAEARRAEDTWKAVEAMVDDRTSRVWASPMRAVERSALGLASYPEHVMVALFTGGDPAADPLDAILRRRALQRASVELARTAADTAAGRVGDSGLVFLSACQGSARHGRRKLLALAERASSLARRRFGLAVGFGVSVLPVALSDQYQAALAAAESGLSRGVAVGHAEPGELLPSPLSRLRQELVRSVEQGVSDLPARFDQFLEAVSARFGHQLEPARAHVEALFERMGETLLRKGALDARSLEELAIGASRQKSGSAAELFAVYRRVLGDIVDAVERPAPARRDRSLRRAEEFVKQHYAEPLRLPQVARMAGFAPTYFSRLFHEKHGMTFARHLSALRFERAKQLLSRTSLTVQRVAELSGYSDGQYLGRVFRQMTGEAPRTYRQRLFRGKAQA
jgi:AraC-like DNA-binding protein/alkylhydroperoxidase/carboxymuconolactone decarboxylase family protein YurZ